MNLPVTCLLSAQKIKLKLLNKQAKKKGYKALIKTVAKASLNLI